MKKNILVLSLILFSNFAFADVIAQYSFGQRTQAGQFKKITASVADSGKLLVSVDNIRDQFSLANAPGKVSRPIRVITLSDDKFEEIFNLTVQLSNAPISEIFTQVVCQMMPGPSAWTNHLYTRRNFDQDSQEFLEGKALVFGPTGCWVSFRTFPTVDTDYKAGQELKSLLKKLVVKDFQNNLS